MLEAIVIILAYLIGSIPSGLLVGKIGYGIDIREHGSGNLGGTNTFRTLGKKAGFIVTIADILKGTLATALPFFFGLSPEEFHPLLVGTFAVIGHMYPIFANFKGGKAVATSGGVLLLYSPLMFITMLALFLLCILITKYVSLSSMLTGLYALIYSIFTGDLPLIIVISVLVIFIFYRHRANIKRIIDKTEPKVHLLKSKGKHS
ncbi:glycerol-3-phosphate 1-O-acyltransferase PlsY [Bacillus suaedaesalsae]|uniref:Glycerol-3-phosphate acyltransferase n=1 Tax=Bacillus suaedaesalsae TaxID=2810349 RepID=A0ABS2DK95_9BACI|nr:glycerol-3-phosphate 1-O-acyltransferase PlsY [Bacillus suaedaesalsae]MBM6618837.1 glycerol-3-phosphate 1-O-acyltransferase PlsY [Bacillus suaedaesalsae]